MRYMFVFVVLMFGCAERQAQTAVQTSLTALAEGLNTTDVLVLGHLSEAANAARTKVVAEHPTAAPDELFAAYADEMRPWYTAADRMEEVRAILQVGQVAVNTWIASGVLSSDWGRFCEQAGEQFEQLVQAIDDVTEETIPSEIVGAGPTVALVCRMAESYFTGRE